MIAILLPLPCIISHKSGITKAGNEAMVVLQSRFLQTTSCSATHKGSPEDIDLCCVLHMGTVLWGCAFALANSAFFLIVSLGSNWKNGGKK